MKGFYEGWISVISYHRIGRCGRSHVTIGHENECSQYFELEYSLELDLII